MSGAEKKGEGSHTSAMTWPHQACRSLLLKTLSHTYSNHEKFLCFGFFFYFYVYVCHKSKNSLTITDPSCICQAHLCCWTQLDEPQKNKGQLVPTVSDGYRLSENQCVDIQAMKTVTLSIHTALRGSKGSRSSFLVVKIRKESQKRLKALCLGGILSSKMGRRKRRWQGNDCRRDTEAACPAACSSLLSQCFAERRHITSHY